MNGSSQAGDPRETGGVPTIIARAIEAMGRPDLWTTMDLEVLQMMLFLRLARYGNDPDTDSIGELSRLYGVFRERLPAQARLQFEQIICDGVMERRTGYCALLPFMICETDDSVVSTASLDLAMLMPREHGDPLTGPKFILARFERAGDAPMRQLGMLSGLLLLGDERLLPLIKGKWKEIKSAEHRSRLAAARSGFVLTLQVEFLLDWLETTGNEGDIGAIAAAMVKMPYQAQAGAVMRQRRCFPASDAAPGKAIECLESVSFPEYAERIRPRLERLIARESEPKVIPMILTSWLAADK
jgi:hypothetical protein